MLSNNEGSKSLILCRTPLQARICGRLFQNEGRGSYDLIYYTQDDSEADRAYFKTLSLNAKKASYIYVEKQRFDIFNSVFGIFELNKKIKIDRYSSVYLASIDSLVFRFALKLNPKCALYTFDDGAANITSGGSYHLPKRSFKTKIYEILFGVQAVAQVKSQIITHYSIYPGFENIVDENKIEYVRLFDTQNASQTNVCNKRTRFFIGQPFGEYLDFKKVELLKAWLSIQKIDYYVMHPRESEPLIKGIPILDKGPQLAEDAIFAVCGDTRPHIFSAYSSVLFNVSLDEADKTYLSLGSDAQDKVRLDLVAKSGATPLLL